MKFCSECGSKLEDEDMFCSECGYRFEEKKLIEEKSKKNVTEKKYRSNNTIILLIFALVIGVVTVICVIQNKEPKSDKGINVASDSDAMTNGYTESETEVTSEEILLTDQGIETEEAISTDETTTVSDAPYPEELVFDSTYSYKITLPIINSYLSVCVSVNETIKSKYVFDELQNCEYITYDWKKIEDILTLIIISAYPGDNIYYDIYVIDLADDKLMERQDILDYYDLTEEAFVEKAKITLGNKCDELYPNYYEDTYLEVYVPTMDSAYESVPYIWEDGKLYLCGKIYSLAGAEYYYHLVQCEQ